MCVWLCAVCSVSLGFFFLGTRSGIRIGLGLTQTDHNPIGFVNFNPIEFQSRPEPEIYRVGSGQVGSGKMPTPTCGKGKGREMPWCNWHVLQQSAASTSRARKATPVA